MVTSLLLAAPGAFASDSGSWAFSVGQFDIARDEKPWEVGIEYRFPSVKLWSLPLTPAVGISGNEDESFWVYGTMKYDWELSDRWVLSPSLGMSLYEEGDGKDLGHVIEFRSALEIAYRLHRDKGGRIGLLFYHLSNASISSTNPGSNSLVLTFATGR